MYFASQCKMFLFITTLLDTNNDHPRFQVKLPAVRIHPIDLCSYYRFHHPITVALGPSPTDKALPSWAQVCESGINIPMHLVACSRVLVEKLYTGSGTPQ